VAERPDVLLDAACRQPPACSSSWRSGMTAPPSPPRRSRPPPLPDSPAPLPNSAGPPKPCTGSSSWPRWPDGPAVPARRIST